MRRFLLGGFLVALTLASNGCGPQPSPVLATGVGGRLPRMGKDPGKVVIPNATNKAK
jgi:hypothetical protein